MNSRYYNSNTGRFLSQDSYKGNAYEPWTQNLYAYCGNNPVNMVDPTGHCPYCFSRPGEAAYDRYVQSGGKPCYEQTVTSTPTPATTTSPTPSPTATAVTSDTAGLIKEGINEAVGIAEGALAGAANSSSIAAAQLYAKSTYYMGGGVYTQIPNGLADAYTAQANNMKAASKALKGAGVALVVVDAGIDVYNNITNDNLTTSRKITDSVVDVGVDVGTFGGAAAAGSAAGTAFGPGFGTAAGFIVGVVSWYFTENTPVVDWIKEVVTKNPFEFDGEVWGPCRRQPLPPLLLPP